MILRNKELLPAPAFVELLQLLVSSSFAVYGQASDTPVAEDSACCKPTSMQGHAAQLVEVAVQAYAAAMPGFSAAVLRHGVVIGTHPNAEPGE
jgi:UDP-glucose 4-epimerase